MADTDEKNSNDKPKKNLITSLIGSREVSLFVGMTIGHFATCYKINNEEQQTFAQKVQSSDYADQQTQKSSVDETKHAIHQALEQVDGKNPKNVKLIDTLNICLKLLDESPHSAKIIFSKLELEINDKDHPTINR